MSRTGSPDRRAFLGWTNFLALASVTGSGVRRRLASLGNRRVQVAMPLPSRPERQRGQHDAQRTTSAGEATLSPSLSYGARDAIRWVPECPSSPAVPVEQPVEQPRVPSASSIRARACYSIQRKGVIRTMTDTVDGVGVWAHDRVCRLACQHAATRAAATPPGLPLPSTRRRSSPTSATAA